MERDMDYHKNWLSFRPEITVLDCTIRDGGLINNHHFETGVVRAVYTACAEAGVDYMEVGYKGSKKIYAPSEFGPWKYCDEESLRSIVGENGRPVKLCAMADAERTDYHEDILPKQESVLDVIRVACYIHQVPAAVDMIKDAADKGYETTVNLMAVSTVAEAELDAALETFARTEACAIYLVDSFGALYSEQIRALTQKYAAIGNQAGKQIGIHAHNNQQLAYANTIEAIIAGANRIDATIDGLGRGAGNCPLELILGFLHNPKFKVRPILKCIQDHIRPLRSTMQWGYDIPYMITGQLNQHPRSAIKFMESSQREDIVGFYDAFIQAE